MARITFAFWLVTALLGIFAITSALDARWRDAGESGGAAVFAAVGAVLLTRRFLEEKKRLAKARRPLPNRR